MIAIIAVWLHSNLLGWQVSVLHRLEGLSIRGNGNPVAGNNWGRWQVVDLWHRLDVLHNGCHIYWL